MFFFHLLSRSPEALYKDREGQHFWWGNILEPWQAHPENRPVEPVPNEAIYAPWRQSLWSLQEPTLTWRRKVPMITCVSEFFRRVSDSFLHINFNEVNISCIHSRSFTVRPWKVSETQKKPDRLPTIGGVGLPSLNVSMSSWSTRSYWNQRAVSLASTTETWISSEQWDKPWLFRAHRGLKGHTSQLCGDYNKPILYWSVLYKDPY